MIIRGDGMDYVRSIIELIDGVEVFSKTEKYDYNGGVSFLADEMKKLKSYRGRLFFIGNGGSAAIACHMTADYLKNGGISTCSLYNSSVLTCLGNDYGYEYVFSKQIEMLMGEGDLLCAISSSGNSPNIINAIEEAHVRKGRVITFTGFDRSNRALGMGDINVYVPSNNYGMVESIHNLMLQQIVDSLMVDCND